MPTVDFDWVKSQLSRKKPRKISGDAAITLLNVWDGLEFPNEHQEQEALELFTSLAGNKALVAESEEKWVSAQAGFMLTVGNEVRVRADAFAGEAGRLHNGRRGRIVAKRSGDIIVKLTDGLKGDGESVHYPPSALEIRQS